MQRRDEAASDAALVNGLGLRELALGNLRRSKVCVLRMAAEMTKVLSLCGIKVKFSAGGTEADGPPMVHSACALREMEG